MGKSQRVDALLSRHNDLESLIEEEEKRSHPDDITIHDLKKQKLRIKDELLSMGAA
ncbi:MAG: YdcH family protein [Rhodospirillales bacterium]